MSRSVTVAVAYIMSVTNLNWKEALKVVRVNRAVANPNSGFQKQLQEFENTRITEVSNKIVDDFKSPRDRLLKKYIQVRKSFSLIAKRRIKYQ